MIVESVKCRNPWIGLESYREGDVLYGRDDDIRDLTQAVLSKNETLLYGKSGIGKSSVLNAGVLPTSRRRGYLPVIVRLSHKDNDDSYLQQIITAITSSGGRIDELSPPCGDVGDGVDSLYGFFHRHTFYDTARGNNTELLLIFDQFEEIFTLQHNERCKRTFFSDLADLINDVVPLSAETSGAEFSHDDVIDYDAYLSGLLSVVDNSGDVECESTDSSDTRSIGEAISVTRPHIVFTIREDYLSEFEYYSASIPSLRHNRYGLRPLTISQALDIIMCPRPGLVSTAVAKVIIGQIIGREAHMIDGDSALEVDAAVLSLFLNRLYEVCDGVTITEALVRDYGGAIISDFYLNAIASISPGKVEYLEDALLNSQGRRDNIAVSEAQRKGHLTADDLELLCNRSKILRLFNYCGDYRIELIHDILCPVVAAHKASRIQEQQLLNAQREQALLVKRMTVERRRNRKRLLSALGVVALVFVMLIAYYVLFVMPVHAYYGSFTTEYGWPKGIGARVHTPSERDSLIVYYRLTRTGLLHRRPYTKVEVVNRYDTRATNIFVAPPAVGLLSAVLKDTYAAAFANLLLCTSSWQYTASDDTYDYCSSCTAYDIEGNELYSVHYYKDITYASGDPEKYVQWAVFYSSSGKQMIVTDNGIDRMRETVDKGIVTGCVFFTEIGSPQRNPRGSYGEQYVVDDQGQIVECYGADKYGNRLFGDTITYCYNYFGRVRQTNRYKVFYYPGKIEYHYDDFVDYQEFSDSGRLRAGRGHIVGEGAGYVDYSYGESGNVSSNILYSSTGEVIEGNEYTYLANSDKPLRVRTTIGNDTIYIKEYEYSNNGTTVLRYFDGNGKKCMREYYTAEGDRLYFHKMVNTTVQDSLYTIQTIELCDTLGQYVSTEESCYSKCVIKRELTTDNVKLRYFFNERSKIQASQWFEYDEYGKISASAVAGIDGTPVRCPNWDLAGLTYYTSAYLYPFMSNDINSKITLNGINEFGEESYICRINRQGQIQCVEICEMPYNYNYCGYKWSDVGTELVTYLPISKTVWYDGSYGMVLYMHLLSHDGMCSRAGLRDGDVVISINNISMFPYNANVSQLSAWQEVGQTETDIVVARIDGNSNYQRLSYRISSGIPDAETHPMYITQREYQRLNTSTQ